ncbi:diphthamide biosynthesis protein 2 [Plectosphaerella cucumerina]|uniref:2-(3-amino-3-carboxypropyl)histidine synthase subunit 2 n=1 Tax=Plectosphaerella cucumerina TaxID=40658 RepID=A0A8K0X006_9PEZI|nr:diphthamide biosynthesis protein 2 [Plectosphaerella cucumerina]
MDTPVAPPVLSTPAEYTFEDPTPAPPPPSAPRSDEELRDVYEIARAAREIKQGGWTRVALQFPDHMLSDASWVVEALKNALAELPSRTDAEQAPAAADTREALETDLTTGPGGQALVPPPQTPIRERIYILADTSYSACCVDEIAAEHADAHVVVHYGRSCLSPTSRLPVIYVFTRNPLDHDAAVTAFQKEFPDKGAKVILMADLTYQDHVAPLAASLRSQGYVGLLHTTVVHDPAGAIPNRRVAAADASADAESNAEAGVGSEAEVETGADVNLAEYSLFHISTPPAALLLALQTRMASLHVLDTSSSTLSTDDPTRTTGALLRRRYAKVLTLASAGVVGILVNTLSVANYMSSIDLLRRRIADAGKKSYTVVVGKLNPAKLANFAEIDGWVVVGCWESGLVEEDSGFYRPVITPFEMEAALLPDEERVWGLEWWAGIEKMKAQEEKTGDGEAGDGAETESVEGGVEDEESAPPQFDLRTGKLITHSQPMRVVVGGHGKPKAAEGANGTAGALIKQDTGRGELATINGVVSPGAEFLRSKRTWQGLGTDHDGEETSTVVEEGRSGVARGYTVGEDSSRA